MYLMVALIVDRKADKHGIYLADESEFYVTNSSWN